MNQLELHDKALKNPKAGYERAFVTLLSGLREYMEAHRKRFNTPLSEDGYCGEVWDTMVESAIMLLNSDHGDLDAASMERLFRALKEDSEFCVEGVSDAAMLLKRELGPTKKRRLEPPAPGAVEQIGLKRLTERQQELLGRMEVTSDNVAVYTGTERIADWSALKSVMLALGGKWKTKQGFHFPYDIDALEVLRLAKSTGEILDPKAAEFFETNEVLADEMAEFIDPVAGGDYLEPSAGRGALVRALLKKCMDARVYCFEPLEQFRKELIEISCNVEVIGHDFTKPMKKGGSGYDGVIMNPPFSKLQDVRHIARAFDLLKPGGRLAAIASSAVLYRDTKEHQAIREIVAANRGTIGKNPPKSFAASGTNVETVMIKVEKARRRAKKSP